MQWGVKAICLVLFYLAGTALCAAQTVAETAQQLLNFATTQANNAFIQVTNGTIVNTYPFLGYVDETEWMSTNASGWTSGYLPGILWQLYNNTYDSTIMHNAIAATYGLSAQANETTTPHIGVQIYNSFVHAFDMTRNPNFLGIVQTAAHTLSTSYRADVGVFQSLANLAQNSSLIPVIIDTIMDMELLFWASQQFNEPIWAHQAFNHANQTMINHFRSDGSTFDLVNYAVNGSVDSKLTLRGYQDNSTWARGQSWAIYGFSMAFRYTGYQPFLATSQRAANYFISHLASDNVPFWDFNVPLKGYVPRDTSAAAIAISGLLELSHHLNESSQGSYTVAAQAMLQAINSPEYLATTDPLPCILTNSTENMRDNPPLYDLATAYGDYYFVEAMRRLLQVQGSRNTPLGNSTNGGGNSATPTSANTSAADHLEPLDITTWLIGSLILYAIL